MFNHVCIKPGCGKQYRDDDPDAYLCAEHLEERKAVAAQVDATMSTRPKKAHVTPLQAYDQAAKIRGFMPVKL